LTGLTLGGVAAVHAEGTYKNNAPEQETTQPRSSSDFSGEGSQYTVQEGDTLASIAEEHLGSADQWQLIAQANDLSNPDRIQVGQTLTIPASSGERSDAAMPDSGIQSRSDMNSPDDSGFQSRSDMSDPGSAALPGGENVAEPDTAPQTARDFESDKANDPAAENDPAIDQQQEIRGEITEIASGNESVTLKDEQGMTHNLKLEDQDVVDGVSVGDFVKAELEGGTVISLEKVDRSA
jgi:LysM repeat protein